MVSSSPTATITNLPSRVKSMPRGRWPTLIVLVTVQLSVSITDTVLLFSFETYAMNACAGAAVSASPDSNPTRHARNVQVLTLMSSLQLAFALRAVIAEGVELGDLVQKTLLRRHRHHHATVDQQDRLAQLQVPIAQGQLCPLESGDREIRPLDEIGDLLDVAGIGARGSLSDHAHGGPRLHVERG